MYTMEKIKVIAVSIFFICYSSFLFAAKESPMLAKMVESGNLPPLEDRLPENPLVEKPVSEIGKYGGKLVLGTAFFLDDERYPSRLDRNGLFQFTYPFPSNGPIKPNLAESWKWNEAGTELTIKLRKGIKWSDGVPFTVDDVLFFMEDIVDNKDVAYIWFYESGFYEASGNFPSLTKIDDFTLKINYDKKAFLFEKKYSNVIWAALPNIIFAVASEV